MAGIALSPEMELDIEEIERKTLDCTGFGRRQNKDLQVWSVLVAKATRHLRRMMLVIQALSHECISISSP
jgi:hypothetical protein